MVYAIYVDTVTPRVLAAVRRRVRPGEVPAAFGPALGEVWPFLNSRPDLHSDGHNIFLYHHGSGDDAAFDVDFGVEVTRRFPAQPPLSCVETPAGRAAVTIHRGAYASLRNAHQAIHRWCDEHGEGVGTWSMEIYGDWHEDETTLETTVIYALT